MYFHLQEVIILARCSTKQNGLSIKGTTGKKIVLGGILFLSVRNYVNSIAPVAEIYNINNTKIEDITKE